MDPYAVSEEEALLIPPDNFTLVEPGIYRAGFPSKKNFPFLKTLHLRTVLYLCPEEYPEPHLSFLTQTHTQLLQYGVQGNKEPCLEIPHDIMSEALLQVLDTRNHPMLIHCNKGKHRTGCLVGLLRKVLGWSLSSIFEEYRLFSRPKERFVDMQFMECWTWALPADHPAMQAARRDSCMVCRSDKEASRAQIKADKEEEEKAKAEEEEEEKAAERCEECGRGSAPSSSDPASHPASAYLRNPEANEHLHRKAREKEQAQARAGMGGSATAGAYGSGGDAPASALGLAPALTLAPPPMAPFSSAHPPPSIQPSAPSTRPTPHHHHARSLPSILPSQLQEEGKDR